MVTSRLWCLVVFAALLLSPSAGSTQNDQAQRLKNAMNMSTKK